MAERHALTSARAHVRGDGSTAHVALFDPATGALERTVTWQGYADSSAWARGQAWAIHGFTASYGRTRKPELLLAAQRTADWFIAHLPPDGVPYWDFRDPAIPRTERDASAAAIAASGLYDLARYATSAGETAIGRRPTGYSCRSRRAISRRHRHEAPFSRIRRAVIHRSRRSTSASCTRTISSWKRCSGERGCFSKSRLPPGGRGNRPQHRDSGSRTTFAALPFADWPINYIDRQVLGILAPTLQRARGGGRVRLRRNHLVVTVSRTRWDSSAPDA